MLAIAGGANAQNNGFEEYRAKREREYNTFKDTRRKELEEFRRKRNEEFAEFVRKRWEEFEAKPAIPKPKEEEVPPVVIDDLKSLPTPEPLPLPFDDIITIEAPKPQPIPIKPIEELPEDDEKKQATVDFSYYGTAMSVRIVDDKLFSLKGMGENDIADAWLKLSTDDYTNLIHDCLKLRADKNLCDWAYLQMLQEMANRACGKNTNEATLLMAYVYCQSGYKMKLAQDGGRLYMLYASSHIVYDNRYFLIDGEMYYMFGDITATNMNICPASFPKEQEMSFQITRAPQFSWDASSVRTLKSQRYPNMTVDVACNKNMIDFYSSYPSSEVDDNFMTHWAVYANTPFGDRIKSDLYPALKSHLVGLSQKEAVERLLNWVQTAFVYEYDDKVWGHDRAFFPEETLYYPYADCEDRSILFTRLVRDLLGLKCILVYYPGHLATAVCFSETVNGDYISLNGERYVVCDPTYIGAPIGRTMPNMNNAQAKVILLHLKKN